MADWLKWSKGLARKREVVAISSKLKIDRRQVAGMCMEIWEWADDNTTDGNAPSVTKSFLDEVVGVTGFADQLVIVGWLNANEDGIEFVHFDRHNGNSAKSRALGKNRTDKSRKGCNAPTVTKALPEKIREDKNRPITTIASSRSENGAAPESSGDGGGGVGGVGIEEELRESGILPEVITELAALPGLTRTFIRLAYRQAERDADRNPSGLLAKWIRNGTTPPLDLSPERVTQLVNAGDIVVLGDTVVSPGSVAPQSDGLRVWSDSTKTVKVKKFPKAELTPGNIEVSYRSAVKGKANAA